MKIILLAGLVFFAVSYIHASEPKPPRIQSANPDIFFDELSKQAWIDFKTNGTPIPEWLKWDQQYTSPELDPNYKKRWGFSSPRELVRARIAMDAVAPFTANQSTRYTTADEQTNTNAANIEELLKEILVPIIKTLEEKGVLSDDDVKRVISQIENYKP